MSDKKSVRLNKLVKEFNVSIDRIYSFLESKGIDDLKPNTKVSHETYMELLGEFDSEKKAKLSADLLAKEKELEKAEEIIKQQEKELKEKTPQAALTELFIELKSDQTPAVVERIVNDIDEIVKIVRFPGWQDTSTGQKKVKSELRRTLLKYKLHKEEDLFDRAYGYIREYYQAF